MIEVDLYNRIREMNVVEGLSQREVARRLGISRNTVRKYWDGGVIPGACKPRKRDPVVMTEDVISAIKKYLEEDREAPQKQQHTATRIYQRLVDEKDLLVVMHPSRVQFGRFAEESKKPLSR